MAVKRTKLFYMVWLYLVIYLVVVLKGVSNFSQSITTTEMQTQFELSMGLLLPHILILFIGLIVNIIACVKFSYKMAFISALIIMLGSGIYPHNFWWVSPAVLTAFLAYVKQKQLITRNKNKLKVITLLNQ